MDLKVLFMFLIYYSVISLFFVFATSSGTFGDYNSTINLNSSDITDDEIDTGGLFGTGISFGRFTAMVGFGVGLPDDTPSWFSIIFIAWQSIITILFIGFVISSIWNG